MPGSRHKKHDEISEIDRRSIIALKIAIITINRIAIITINRIAIIPITRIAIITINRTAIITINRIASITSNLSQPTVDFRTFVISRLWAYGRFPKFRFPISEIGRDPGTLKSDIVSTKTSTINLFGFETLKLKIRRLKLWKPTVGWLKLLVIIAIMLIVIIAILLIVIIAILVIGNNS